MDHAKFFEAVRHAPFNGLSESQVAGIEAIMAEAEKRQTPLQFLAYMLATAFHETATHMQPIEEFGKGRAHTYGKPAGPYGHIYFGRGYVQCTWLSNYEHMGEIVGEDLVQFPEKALEPAIAAEIMFAGMTRGSFTGKKLSDYIGQHGADYYNARRIINGNDQAAKIAGEATAFEKALRAGGYAH